MKLSESTDAGMLSLLRFRARDRIQEPQPYDLETGAQRLAEEMGCERCEHTRQTTGLIVGGIVAFCVAVLAYQTLGLRSNNATKLTAAPCSQSNEKRVAKVCVMPEGATETVCEAAAEEVLWPDVWGNSTWCVLPPGYQNFRARGGRCYASDANKPDVNKCPPKS